MANNEYAIVNLVSPDAKKQVEELILNLNKASEVAKKISLDASNYKNIKSSADAQEKLNKAQTQTEINAKKIEAINQKMEINAQKEIERRIALENKANSEKLRQLEKEAQQQQKLLEKQQKRAEQENKLLNNFKNAPTGSIQQLTSANAILNDRLKKVNQTTEEGKRKADNLRSALDKNHKKINEMNPDFIKQKNNIGNYASALDGTANKLGGAIKGLVMGGLATIGISTGIGGIVSMFKGGISSAIHMEEATEKLNFALNENSEATKRMMAFADKMSSKSLFSKSSILDAEQFALSLGRSETQTKSMIEAAMGLSRITGVDLNTAMGQLNMTFSGSVGRMAKYAPELKNLTSEQLKSGKAVDLLRDKLGKFATSGLDSTAGKIEMAKKSWSGLWRTLAEGSTGILGTLAEGFTSVVKSITNWVKVPISKKMEEERIKVNMLTESLKNNSLPQQVRVKAYDELKKIAPSVVAGIDAENVNIVKLNGNLANYNKLTIQRIALKAKEEIMIEKEKEVADNIKRVYELNLTVSEYVSKKIMEIDSAVSVAEAQSLNKRFQVLKSNYENNKISAEEYVSQIGKVWSTYYKGAVSVFDAKRLDKANLDLNNSLEESKKSMEDFAKFQSDLEKQFGVEAINPKGQNIPQIKSPEEIKAEKEKLKKIDEDYVNYQIAKSKELENQYKNENETANITTDAKILNIEKIAIEQTKQLVLKKNFDKKWADSEIDKKTIEINANIEANNIIVEKNKQTNEILLNDKDNLIENWLKIDENYIAKRTIQLDINKSKELYANANLYAQRLITKKEYEKENQRIEQDYARRSIELSILSAEIQLNNLKKIDTVLITEEQTKKIEELEKELYELKAKLRQDDADNEQTIFEKRMENLGRLAEKSKEIWSSISDITSSYYDNQLTKMDAESKQNEINKNKELEKAGDNQEKKDKINKKYDEIALAQQKKRDQIEYKKALWDKAQKMIEIAINIAMLISKQDYFSAALAGAALVNASMKTIPPPPQYAQGTNYHFGGLAIVGDGGMSEAITTPYGETFLSPNKSTLIDLPRGSKVLNGIDTEKLLNENKINYTFDFDKLSEKQDKTNKLLTKIVEKQQNVSIFVESKDRITRLKYN